MKKLLFTLTLATALAVGSQTTFAQAKKKGDAPATAAAEKPKAAADTAKPKAEGDAKGKAGKARGFYISADEIDAAGKAFCHVNKKDNKKVKYVLAANAEIMNDGKPAKFEDIKVGDYVSGSLVPKSDTENEIMKISKFGAKAAKEGEGKKPSAEGSAKKPAGEAKPK